MLFRYLKILILLTGLFGLVPHAMAKLTMSSLFNDHMVLQRDKPVLFWGETSAKQKVSVKINGQQVETIADEHGQWKLTFPATAKGGPYVVNIQADESKQLNDVYFGDVWIAGGQSNMEWKLDWQVNNKEQELADANYPQIRFFDVPNTTSYKKEQYLPASSWKLANKNNAAEFSAVAWFFAKHVHHEEGVAVGVIDSNWGGTPAEAWTDAEIVKELVGYKKQAEHVISTKNWPTVMAENNRLAQLKNQLMGDEEGVLNTQAYTLDTDVSDWKPVTLPAHQGLQDFVWLRHSANLKHDPQSDVELNFGLIEQEAFIFVNGKQVARKTWKDTSATFILDKSVFKKGENLIVLRAVNGWSNRVKIGRKGELWLLVDGHKMSLESQWLYSNAIEPSMPKVKRYSSTIGFLYNAMIHPLLRYASKGVIWYQGESNANQHMYYKDLFSALIKNWRSRAEDDSLPFLFVQLAAFMQPQPLQPKSNWGYLRDAQKQTLALDNTGMAVTIDIGEPDDIHPRNKQDVGYRLWLQAASKVYGRKVMSSGPDFKDFTVKGSNVTLSFDFANGFSTTDSTAPTGFIIAGEDRKFYVASAEIKGDKVIVSSPHVIEPKAVRYAWSNYPEVNLINKAKLPSVPFRTDDWPIDSLH